MDPVTLMAIGFGLQAFGQLRQGMASKKAASYNQALLAQAIQEEEYRAEIVANKIREEKRRTEGVQEARYAKAGVKIEGTPLEVLADTAAHFEEDLALNEYNKRAAISRLKLGIAMEQYKADEAMTAAFISAGATVLQGYGAAKTYAKPTTSTYGYWGPPG